MHAFLPLVSAPRLTASLFMAVLFLFPMVKRAVNRTPLWSTVKPRTETSLRLLLQKLCRLRRRWCLRLQYCLSSYCGSLSRPALRPRSVNPARSLFIYSRAVLLQCFTLFGAWAKVVSSLSTSCRRPVQTFFTTLALTTFVVSAPLAMSVLRARLLRAQLSPDPVSAPGGPASVRTLIHPTGVPYCRSRTGSGIVHVSSTLHERARLLLGLVMSRGGLIWLENPSS